MLLRNAWYAAAWADEVGGEPLARTILNEPLVLFRGAGNAVSVLQDRCPHRGVPLSKGCVTEGTLECAYHGLRFDARGHCVRMPGQDTVPGTIAAKAYPSVERWRWIWVWIGDPAAADPDAIPAMPWLSDPAWVAPTGRIHLRAGHELLIENLQNHMHLQFVHRRTIGTDDICAAKTAVKRVGDTVYVERWLLDKPAPPLFAKAGNLSGNVDRWFNSVFLPPSTTILDIGCAITGTGAPAGDRSRGIEIRSLHAVTPETETTTHYFWAYARNFRIDEPDVTAMLRAGAEATFAEDVAILESQQANAEHFVDGRFTNLPADRAGVLVDRVRRELAARG